MDSTSSKKRFPTAEAVAVEIYGRPGHNLVAQLKNLSQTGAFLQWLHTQDSILTGDLLRLTVVLTSIGKKRLVNASVVWANATGVGIQFVSAEQIFELLAQKSDFTQSLGKS